MRLFAYIKFYFFGGFTIKNFSPFAKNYTEVTIPLDEKAVEAFEQSGEYSYLLTDFYRANINPAIPLMTVYTSL